MLFTANRWNGVGAVDRSGRDEYLADPSYVRTVNVTPTSLFLNYPSLHACNPPAQ